ncbi:major facilitator superfamily domain-containing protein [Mycotypha africana]|uniref:major facilitator superfamily domain-containing protein n=1 Tax=Mycotypha africana TaxID=64632 RepID=UPI0022FFF416|nr:major facilitator superfamily domain-containing protein [Mycotypha africana]KAI8984282.1 major facilitator superfamily domain-containing protein [Mycotypha africana]
MTTLPQSITHKKDNVVEIESLNLEEVEAGKLSATPNLAYDYKTDPNHPWNWPRRKKSLILLLVGTNAFMGYFSSAVYIPASHDIMLYFNTNLTVINATIALFLLMIAIAPLFWAPFSERIGRRWIYITSMLFFAICSAIVGISRNLGLFFAFRLIQGIFVCAGQALGGGTVSDIFEPHERGKAMSIYILSTILGPSVAPMIGGYVDQYLGWRWIFYLKAIIGGVIVILNVCFLKETLYAIPNSSCEKAAPTNRLQSLQFNPFTSLQLLLKKEVALVCLPTSVAFGWFYFQVTILPTTYSSIYHFSTGTIGLCYLAGGIGNTTGSILSGLLSDKLYTRACKRNGGVAVKEFRLRPIYFGIPALVAGSILYGWFLHISVHWIGPLFGYLMVTFGIMYTVTVVNTYLADSFATKAASIVSVNNFTRNVCGMIFSLTAVQIRDSLGDGWAYTVMGLMSLVIYMISIPIVERFGARWRNSIA